MMGYMSPPPNLDNYEAFSAIPLVLFGETRGDMFNMIKKLISDSPLLKSVETPIQAAILVS